MSEDSGNINISRSDGKVHAIHKGVASSAAAGYLESQKVVKINSVEHHGDSAGHKEHHGHISINRSDGLLHDINKIINETSLEGSVKKDNNVKRNSDTIFGGLRSPGIEVRTGSSSMKETYIPMKVRIVHMSDTHNFL